MRQSILVGSFAILLAACQSGPPPLSVEEAKKVTAEFGGAGFVPPPRTIADITAILDQQKPDESYRTAILARLNEPPSDKTAAALSSYYRVRGDAALTLGLTDQAIDDLRESVRYAREANRDVARALVQLGNAEYWAKGNADTTWHEMLEAARSSGSLYFVIEALENLAESSAVAGDFVSARRLIEEADRTLLSLRGKVAARVYAQAVSNDAEGHGILEENMGHFAEAERWQRKAIAEWRVALAYVPTPVSWTADVSLGANHRHIVTLSQYLTRVLLAQERGVEAEAIAREALLYALQYGGRSSPNAAIGADNLSRVLFWQGRTADAERMSLSAIETSAAIRLGYLQRNAHNHLADAVAMQGRWSEALALYEDAAQAITIDPQYIGLRYITFPRIVALYQTDHFTEGRSLALQLAEQRNRAFGADAPDTALAKGFVAVGLALQGDRTEAIQLFRAVLPQLIRSTRASEQRADQGTLIWEYRRYVLEAYLRLLTGSQTEPSSQSTAAAAFQIVDSLRSAVMAQALTSSAARANLHNPELADLARREQDTRQQINARLSIVANVLSKPVQEQNAEGLATVRAETESLKAAWTVLREQIETRFPDYARLVNPAPASIAEARETLTDQEALVAVYVGERETYVWAVPKDGETAFAIVPLGRSEFAEMVATLRRSLDPRATTVGGIPPFDVAFGYKLYASVLAPVEAGWKGAKRLVVVPHGPLAALPFSLLVTRPVAQPAARAGAAVFSEYRDVPFLAREVAVTQIPTVAAFAALRAVPPGNAVRRQFVGFGDPWFSQQQAAEAKRDAAAAQVTGFEGRELNLRAVSGTEMKASANLSALPRLSDTAMEVREVGLALHADPSKDIFLGAEANERQVRTMKLDDRRVVMFATHGLVPGDLDGLVQPALALSAPSVAGVDGDGLLTMEKILGLKLDADWVVLSACNTAAGNGAGAQAVSGLGRAFFYAGARALLVTNWPVETTSARALTTTVFKRQAADASLSQAEALRASMLSLLDGPGYMDPATGKVVFSYAHPIFWAPFSLVGDGR